MQRSRDVPAPSDLLVSPSLRLSVSPSSSGRPRRAWRAKFGDAFRGCKLGVRGHSSFSVHFFITALVIASAWVFRCDLLQWCVLLGCIGMVLTAELFNSAIEALYHGQDEEAKRRNKGALDIAAGAVLVASIFAAVIGSLIFLARLWEMYAQSRPV